MFERAVRENTYTLTSIAGPSGSGKTYSALLYARGLVGQKGKIALIDTENKRSRHYAKVAGGFEAADLRPPFTPLRYIELIQEAERAGYKVCIVDSISHEWDGTGGCLEMADAIESETKKSGLHCWKAPKMQHKRLINTLLQARMHLIFCCRTKEVVRQERQNGKTVIVKEGYAAIQEKNFIYEMTVSMLLDERTHVPVLTKCPEDLLVAFPNGRCLSPETGETVRQWAEEGIEVDEKREEILDIARSAANLGTDKFKAWFKDQERGARIIIKTAIGPELQSICAAADDSIAMTEDARAKVEGDVPTIDLHADRLPAGVQRAADMFGDDAEQSIDPQEPTHEGNGADEAGDGAANDFIMELTAALAKCHSTQEVKAVQEGEAFAAREDQDDATFLRANDLLSSALARCREEEHGAGPG